jgi:hypothetical protein
MLLPKRRVLLCCRDFVRQPLDNACHRWLICWYQLKLKFNESAFQLVRQKQLVLFTKICALRHSIPLQTFIDFWSHHLRCSSYRSTRIKGHGSITTKREKRNLGAPMLLKLSLGRNWKKSNELWRKSLRRKSNILEKAYVSNIKNFTIGLQSTNILTMQRIGGLF